MGLSLPGSVLFCCTYNIVRSPMAEGILKHLHGQRIYVDSVGLRTAAIDGFTLEVMAEIGVDLTRHRPKSFAELEDDLFDVIISLSPEAQHRAVELTRHNACLLEFWPTMDPTLVEGSRPVRLDAYRRVRDQLLARIGDRFPVRSSGT